MPLLALLMALAFALPARPDPLLLDRVVAVFTSGGERGKRTVLTLSDLEMEARVALVARGGVEASAGPLPQDTLAASLDWLIAELLLQEEAEQLDLAVVDPQEIAEEIQSFLSRFPSEQGYLDFLREHEIAAADVSRSAKRRLVVNRYLGSRIRLAGGVSDSEVEMAFASRQPELGGMSFEEARAPLRARLEKERRERVVANLVADLRGRSGVRILFGFEEPRETP